MVDFFKGKEITQEKIEKLKDIAHKRYPQEIYDDYFDNVKNVQDLANLHSLTGDIDIENLVIGTDWFLCYTELDYHVGIAEWVSIDNNNKMQQIKEMLGVLKNILIKNKDKIFEADMRHNTSYQIYSKLLQKGYLEEISHKCKIDFTAPPEADNIRTKCMVTSLENFLSSIQTDAHTEYFPHILHQITFYVTDKFIDKYDQKPQPLEKKKTNSTK